MESDMSEPIAIVGLSCRLPGDVNSPDDFWQFLLDKKSGYSDFPPSRINIESWYHPEAVRPGSIVSRGGFFVKHDLDDFDNEFFGISAVEASLMDPCQKQLLEIAYEALESAGLSTKEVAGTKTGVYVGNMGFDQALMSLKETEHLGTYTSTGVTGTILSNRISYVFDLMGPSFTVDTACSSSVYALHLACAGLKNGDCDGALVCASNAIRSIEAQLFSSKLGALSPTSRCHTFDESADGYARADGFGAVYIMRLQDAIKAKRPIRAVIRGTAVGANGHGSGLTHPESEGQAKVIRQAYANAGISDFGQTAYFECHGTGTPVGDPIETHSISTVFAKSRPENDPLLIGSVKTNMGHGEGSAGITQVIKMVLALEHDRLPPSIGVVNPNPAIKFDEWKLKIVTDGLPWPENYPVRRTSINSFGYGGANAHVILEGPETVLPVVKDQGQATALYDQKSTSIALQCSDSSDEDTSGGNLSSPPTSNSVAGSDFDDTTSKIVLCTAKNELSLEKTIETVQKLLKTEPIEDVAYTLAQRAQFSHRAVAVVEKGSDPIFHKGKAVADIQLDFVFTGQGAQWPQMGKELLQFSAFRNSVRRIDEAVAGLPMAPAWTVEEMLLAELSASEMDEPRVAQLMSIALEIAIVDLLADWGIKPGRVAGHSAGEIAAAYAAGYLTMPEAVAVAYYRGRAVSETEQPPGAMLAVGVSQAAAQDLIPAGADIVIGAVNSPRSVTLSGGVEAIEKIKERLDKEKVFNRLVATKGRAYHSDYMKNAAAAYDIPLHDIVRSSKRPTIKAQYFSTVTGSLWTENEIPMSYWRRNMERPVLFHQAVSAMREAGTTLVVEIGPHSTLRSPILDIMKSIELSPAKPFTYLTSLKRKEDGVKCVLNMCGELALSGYEVRIDKINHGGSLLRYFPSYQWDHTTKYVKHNRADHEWRSRKFPRHDLLGSLQPGSAVTTRIWRNILSLHTVPWLADHKVGQHYIFPAAGFMSMAIEAMRQVREQEGNIFLLENVHIGAALMVDYDVEIFLTMRKHALGNTSVSTSWWEFDVSSVRDGISTEHAKGRVSSVSGTQNSHGTRVLPQADMSQSQPLTQSDWYDKITVSKGLFFGTSFRRLSDISRDTQQHRAHAKILVQTTPDMVGMKYESEYVVHPTVLDNCLQLSVLAAGNGETDQAYVPVSVDRLTIFEERGDAQFATLESSGKHVGFKGLYGGAQLTNDTGDVMIGLENLRFVGIPAGVDSRPRAKREPFWRIEWDDDYDAITKEDEHLYFPDEKFWPKQYDYPRSTRVYLAQMWIKQFSIRYPHLMTQAPVNTENKYFIEWAHWLLEQIKTNQPEIDAMSVEERQAAIDAERPLGPEGFKLAWALYDHLPEIISGERPVLEVATKDGLLSKFYETQLIYDKFERAIEVMGFKNPNMKILEIGAGTGSATRLMLKSLTKGGSKRYSSLTYTDISTSFFSKATVEFGEFEDIEYKVYNMEKDPELQDIDPYSYDLVVASCTVHVTANITTTLQSIRKLLKPGGKLLLSEITAEWHDQTFTLGLFPGFYKGYDEGRTRHPFLTPEQWAEEFLKADFSAPELSVNDIKKDFGFTVLTAEALPPNSSQVPQTAPTREQTITLVHWQQSTPVSTHIENLARKQGLSIQHRSFVDEKFSASPEWHGSTRIIVVAELEKPFWKDVEEPAYLEFQRMMRAAESILWVTQGDLMRSEHPEASLINGFLQCLDINPELSVASMDFEKVAARDETMARQILHRDSILPRSNGDKQFRQHEGRWLISRLLPYERLIDDFARTEGSDKSTVMTSLKHLGPVEISTTDPGRLSALYFRADQNLTGPLPAGHVEVQIKAVGMNMMELSSLTGGYDTDDLSSEFSGVVTQVGAGVKNLAIGDRVFAMHFGKFGNYARISENLCQKAISNDQSFADLATLPSTYGTALHALVSVGRIQAGESVLIQTATGGFGFAAISIARLNGAEVYVTAGSGEKRQLLRNLGIPDDHIFSSRNVSTITDMMKATNGRGFDVVLNTSSGDYLHTVSWPSVAPFGRFVELKKVDILDNGQLSLGKFNDGVSFIAVDMHYICRHRPQVLAKLMETIGVLYRDGKIKPLPVTTFPISRIAEAYTEFSRFTHTGKLVLTYDDDDNLPYVPSPSKPKFYADAAYLVIGGLTGIGGYTSRWMVQQGVKNIIFLNRSPVAGEAQETVDKIRAMGASVTPIQGSVSNRNDVKRALTITGIPIRGIVNSALVLRNKEFNKLTVDEVHDTFAAKVEGNIYLHEECLELGYTLDFFVMLSSLTALSHAATQSSYSAANCFMNEFAYYRRKQGLAATSIPMGVIGGVGFMSRHEHNMNHLKRNGHYITGPEELVSLFNTALFREEVPGDYESEPLIAIGTEPTKLGELVEQGSVPVPLWERDARWGVVGIHALKKGKSDAGAGGAAVKGDIKDMIVDRLSKLLWMPVEKVTVNVSLAGLGIDSMITSEFRHWMYQTFKKNISMMELLAQDMTVEKLAELLKE